MNILVDEEGQACLCDFGLSRIMNDNQSDIFLTMTNNTHGTCRWMAPELLRPSLANRQEPLITFGSDVYAMAMVMLEVRCQDRVGLDKN